MKTRTRSAPVNPQSRRAPSTASRALSIMVLAEKLGRRKGRRFAEADAQAALVAIWRAEIHEDETARTDDTFAAGRQDRVDISADQGRLRRRRPLIARSASEREKSLVVAVPSTLAINATRVGLSADSRREDMSKFLDIIWRTHLEMVDERTH